MAPRESAGSGDVEGGRSWKTCCGAAYSEGGSSRRQRAPLAEAPVAAEGSWVALVDQNDPFRPRVVCDVMAMPAREAERFPRR